MLGGEAPKLGVTYKSRFFQSFWTGVIILLFSLIFISPNFGQNSIELDRLLRSEQEVPKVLLVGTFHFGYPGFDTHKTSEANKININSPQRQLEVKELVDYIALYRPTKIMVETGANTGFLMKRYADWKNGSGELRKKEIDQIAFRLLDQFNLDSLCGIDAMSFIREYSRSQDSVHMKPIMEKLYNSVPDSLFESSFNTKYFEWYDLQDERCVEMRLLDYFKESNSNHYIDRMHGHYILSDKTNNFNSVDGLMLNWYSRNLRILKNVQNRETNSSDRIMILIGAGHVTYPETTIFEFTRI